MFGNSRACCGFTTATVILLMTVCQAVLAQSSIDAKSKVFTLEEAVEFALKNYPAVRVSLERASAARGGVALARTDYLPRADMLWQGNRATRNNIFGLLLPQSTIPSISGPVLPNTSNRGVWGSAAGLLFSWEPLDFGRRRAQVESARAAETRTDAELELTRLDVAAATVNAYLTLLAAEQSVHAAQADADRREVFSKAVHALVDSQLRPGADASRADAERARARAALARAQQQEAVSRAVLADLLGIADTRVEVQGGPLLLPPPESELSASDISTHPLAEVQKARVQELRSQVHVLDRAYYPRFNFQSAVYGRGTGANTDGSFAGGTSGLEFDRSNWAAGLSVTFPAFDIFSIRARKGIETSNERAEAARYDQTIQDLTGRFREAQASLEGARRVAESTPVELNAARTAEEQERVRYQAGLATIVEVSDAQSLLVQAETDDVLARLAVWQNLASVAASRGDLRPFLQFLHGKSQGGP